MQRILNERIGLFSLFFLFLFSCFGWYALFQGTFVGYVSLTLALLLGFSFACVSFFLGVLLWHEFYERFLGSLMPFIPALFFERSLIMWGAVFVAIPLTYLAIVLIQREQCQRIRFQYFRINQAGQFYFVIALALTISTAYFTLIREASWEELVPKLRIGESSSTFLLRTLSRWQPELAQVKSGGMTVDEYLLSLTESEGRAMTEPGSEDQLLSLEVSLVPGINERLRQAGLTMNDVKNSPQARAFYLESGHAHFTWLVGGEVKGDEPINAVMAQIIQRKIIRTLDGTEEASRLSGDTIPIAIAIVLFLALVPLGSLLGYIWLFFGYIALLVLFQTRQITIKRHLDEIEELEVPR